MGPLAGLGIHFQHFGNRRRVAGRGRCQNFLDCTRDAHEGDTSFEECRDRHFIGRIQRDGVSAARLGRLIGQPKAGKALQIRRLEVQMPPARAMSKVSSLSTRSG